jgi:integrase
MFDLAVSNRAIIDSPAKPFKILKPERPIRLTPTWAEFQSIIADVRKQKFSGDAEDVAEMLEFMGTAGIGLAECQNLKGQHIDFAAGRIWFYRKKTDAGFSIPIFPQLLPLLDLLKARGKIQNDKNVFAIENPKKALGAACQRLNLPHYSSRALRRCFITRAVELGVDFKTIASWQGHVDGGVLIARTYSHLRNEHSENMTARLVVAVGLAQTAP